MDVKDGILWIAVICGIVLFMGFMKKKAEILLNFLVRASVGTAGIYFLNHFFTEKGIEIVVGINPLNILTVGSLGAGGLGLLYGISFCSGLL